MNRIFRLVWSRQLRAMVVASELASGAHGASSLIDQRAALPAPAMLAVALALALCAGTAAAAENNQTLRDLQALAAKYTQQAPVKVDAEVALAAMVGQPSGNALANVDASVSLGAASSLPVVRHVLPAKVEVAAAVRTPVVAASAPAVAAQLGVKAGVGAVDAPSDGSAAINAAVDAGVAVAPTAGTLVQAKLATALDAGIAGS
ncbi:MAG: ESPR domain-containing protein, partial [Stenotrophomonas sp.]|nr:ESPR domain-containing protein [Stenotrophomonas sp.]